MAFDDLTAEQMEMAHGKNPEVLFELAKKLGRKLTDEEVEMIAGGAQTWKAGPCPKCGSENTTTTDQPSPRKCYCVTCGHSWLM